MGVTESIFSKVQVPGTKIVVAVTRKRRVQLEYLIQTTKPQAFVNRVRNGTTFNLGNRSVIVLQITGSESIDVDTNKMKAKEWNAWLRDEKLEEKKKSVK